MGWLAGHPHCNTPPVIAMRHLNLDSLTAILMLHHGVIYFQLSIMCLLLVSQAQWILVFIGPRKKTEEF